MSTYGDLKISTINGGALSGFRNAIINGNFGINQRGVSGTVTLAAGAYGHDRWKAGASGCTYTFATVENVTIITISAGSLIQVVEGLNLQTGDYTLSWQGTAQGKIGAGSYGNSGITGAVTGGTNLNIEFGTGTLSLVQLEKGSVATPFEFRSIGQELELCQRYYEKTYPLAFVPGATNINGYQVENIDDGLIQRVDIRYAVRKRSESQTFTVYNPVTGASGSVRTNASANYTAGVYGLSETGCFIDYTPSSGEWASFHWTVSSEL